MPAVRDLLLTLSIAPWRQPSRRLAAAVALSLVALLIASGAGADTTARATSLRDSVPESIGFDWSAYGGSVYAGFGRAVARAGDVNGDGFDDVIVGAPDFSVGDVQLGQARVYHGSSSGLEATPAWSAVGGTDTASFGAAMAWAGDINADGYADVIVGEPRYSTGGSYVGRAHVFLGSGTGLATAPSWTVQGTESFAYFGAAVAGVLDVNDDGFQDVVVGAPYQDAGGFIDAGCAYGYFGSATGLASSPSWSVCGDRTSAAFGYSVARAGDVNGDGVPDVLIGAPGYGNGQESEGRAYVYHGAAGGPSANPAWIAESNSEEALFGESVSLAGDVNGDGFDDVVIGAPDYSGAHEDEGRAYVYHGSASGLGAAAAWTADGGAAYSYFGQAVANGFDMHGDSFSDVWVGAPGFSGDTPGQGRVAAFTGSATGLGVMPTLVVEGQQANAWFGGSVAAGYFNGDFLADLLVGAPSYSDQFAGEGAAFEYLFGAAPNPEIVVTAAADDANAGDAAPGDGVCADALGRCTLRAAIQEANALAGADVITFGQKMSITIGAALGKLPLITDRLTIDASGVWDDAVERPGVVLIGDGAGGDECLHLQADGSAVYGLTITGFGGHGLIVAAANCTIGAPSQGKRNVLSGNGGSGLVLWGTGTHNNVIQSNYIGLAPDGLAAQPNQSGVWTAFGAHDNYIGAGELLESGVPDRLNIISGNTGDGVAVEGSGTDANQILGNVIGLDKDGHVGVGNGNGVAVSGGAKDTAVGWSMAAACVQTTSPESGAAGEGVTSIAVLRRPHLTGCPHTELSEQGTASGEPPFGVANLIAGNRGTGVRIVSGSSGTQVAGSTIRNNGSGGVSILDSPNCFVGQNAITGNSGVGVAVSGAAATAVGVQGNRIWANGGKGIALENGANGGISPPVITAAGPSVVSGTACAGCMVEVYSDDADEGARPEAEAQTESDGSWSASGSFSGPNITAVNTSMEKGSSEFSVPWTISPTPTATTTASATATQGPTVSPSPTATVTVAATPSITATATQEATATVRSTETATPRPSASATLTPTPGLSMTPVDTPTPRPGTASPTPGPSRTPTSGASVTPANTMGTPTADTETPEATEAPSWRLFVPWASK